MTGEPDAGRDWSEEAADQGRHERPSVVVYTHSLLEPSMTFIRSHSEALVRYQPVYAGSRRVSGLALPAGRVATANEGGLQGRILEYLFRRYGVARRLVRKLRAHHPVLVHAHFGQSGPAALVLAESLGIPLIVTYHGQDATISRAQASRSWRGREFLRGQRRVMERAALIIAVSDFIRSKLLEQGCAPNRLATLYNGIDISRFRRTGTSREPIVVFVGRFVEKKGCEYLIRAIALLNSQGFSVRGVLVGDGPLRPGLERLAAELRADAMFAGFLPQDSVRDWLERASVVAVPSVTAADGNSEGLPTVILEAQAMETPIVATRHAGNAEGVAAGKSALLVDERDVDGLAQAIRFFCEDAGAVAAFGKAGREFVEDKFDIRKRVRSLEQAYDRVRAVN
jgi:glycosyltransferase involved in cell wall biosynthesis